MNEPSLRQRLELDLKQAMLARDEAARDTLRMVLAEVRSREGEQGRELEEAAVQAVLARAAKTRQESAQQFEAAGRGDLAKRERDQLAVVERYLPRRLSEVETRELVRSLAGELGATSPKDTGRVMKELMARHKGEVDGALASRIVGEVLAS